MISNAVSVFGPVLAGYLCNLKFLGRRYTMVIGALVSMIFVSLPVAACACLRRQIIQFGVLSTH
jgi:sugar phosphate permease